MSSSGLRLFPPLHKLARARAVGPRVQAFLAIDGALDYGVTAQLLQDLGYRHDPAWKSGRCRAFKHPENAKILTLREYPQGQIIGKEAKKVQNHVQATIAASGGIYEKSDD